MSIRSGEVFDSAPRRYEPICKLGCGTFGEVWRIRNVRNGIEQALKVIHQPADSDHAGCELRALELLRNLRHPFLLAPEDYWVQGDRLYIVMELADGSLRALLGEHQALGSPGVPTPLLLSLLAEVAEGVDYLHANNILHRDIKPDNLLTLHGHGKVADCGVARAECLLDQPMSIAGTPRYMAPEVWARAAGPASDCYSLALTYAELRQGAHPLQRGKVRDLTRAHEHGLFLFDEVIGDEERGVLCRALANDPAGRYPTCTDLVNALARATSAP